MISTKVWRDSRGRVERFSVRGHAEAADPGHDIICAAVSVLVTNAINSVEHLLGVHVADDDQVEPGLVECSIPTPQAPLDDKVQLLFESMVYGIQQVADLYPDFVKVTINK